MIPTNKPLIFKNQKTDIDQFFDNLFSPKKWTITLSARQGLYFIYKKLYSEYGSLKVAVSPLACYEALLPIIYNKHKIIFVDISEQTFNIDISKLQHTVDVVQFIHFGGVPVDNSEIKQYSDLKDCILVEDCAQAFGSKFKDEHCGKNSDFAVMSLMKNHATLGGGLVISDQKFDEEVTQLSPISSFGSFYRFLKRYLESRSSYNKQFYYWLLKKLIAFKPDASSIFTEKGINTQVLKSIKTQMYYFDSLNNIRIKNALELLSRINNHKIVPQKVEKPSQPNYNRLFFKTTQGKSNKIVSKLRGIGIGANHITQHSIHAYQKNVYFNALLKPYVIPKQLPNYFRIHDKIFSLPVSAALNESELNHIVKAVNKL